MLAVGRERAAEGSERNIDFIEANAEALPLPDKSFDAVTIAFGIRNVPRIDVALAEAHRVLKIGGRFLCLEFSSVDVPGLDRLYDLYSFNVIPAVGRAVTGDAEAYRYLVESIRKFPRPEKFADMIRAAGFRRVSFERDDRRRGGAAFRLAACERPSRSDRRDLPSRPPRPRRPSCSRARACSRWPIPRRCRWPARRPRSSSRG